MPSGHGSAAVGCHRLDAEQTSGSPEGEQRVVLGVQSVMGGRAGHAARIGSARKALSRARNRRMLRAYTRLSRAAKGASKRRMLAL